MYTYDNSQTVYTQPNDYRAQTAAQIRTFDSAFQDEILQHDFLPYYERQVDQLMKHYRDKEVALSDEQMTPLLNINDLL
jgi:4-alpha-glucanotransferase